MICSLNEQGIITNIFIADTIIYDNEREYYPWNEIGQVYSDEMPLWYAQKRKLEQVDAWTASKITGGFVSSASGKPVTYDSDKDTQLTMQGIALNVQTPLFAEKYPAGCPIRGYKEGSDVKDIFMLTADQVMQWCADLSMHIGECKQLGWIKQAEVESATTKEELDAIVLD